MRIWLPAVDKMPIAALQREATGEFIETVCDVDNGGIEHIIGKAAEAFLPLHLIMRVFRKCFKFSISFQGCYLGPYKSGLLLPLQVLRV